METKGREAAGREAATWEAVGREAATWEAVGREAATWEAVGREAAGREVAGSGTGRQRVWRQRAGRQRAGGGGPGLGGSWAGSGGRQWTSGPAEQGGSAEGSACMCCEKRVCRLVSAVSCIPGLRGAECVAGGAWCVGSGMPGWLCVTVWRMVRVASSELWATCTASSVLSACSMRQAACAASCAR
jgi:hypothetical protein